MTLARPAALLALLLPALFTSPARAQDDAAAGLFTEARQLPLVSQALSVEVDGDEALLHLTQVFANEGGALGQADYQLHLPEGASVEGFGFWVDDRYLPAALQARDEARAAHTAAASEGRATSLMEREGGIHRFSVYPVAAGGLKQVETTLRLPVEVEGGRRELRLPVDRFLGQAGATSTVTVRLAAEHPVADLGLTLPDGVELAATVLDRPADGALLVATTRQPLVLHWQEQGPPLDLVARRVDTPDGVGLALRVSLDDAGLAGSPWERVVLLVDGSPSMGRRKAAVEGIVARVGEVAGAPLRVRTVTSQDAGGGRVDWPAMQRALEAEGCGEQVRCVVVTDAQLPGIVAAEGSPVELLVLADPHEAAFFASALPPRASVHQPGVEAPARLRAAVDEAVLPVLEIEGLSVGDRRVEPIGPGPWRVAEGGVLRLHALVEDLPAGPLTVQARLQGEPLVRTVALVEAGAEDGVDGAGARVRRAVYRDQLAALLRGWKDQPEEGLQARITELSLREGIPTAFTSLQVDDPELSLVAIKPGDPTLRVDGAPGVTDVVAWYPFGQMRRLAREDGVFSDRFLVPRFWREQAYRVDTFSRGAGGGVVQQGTWYVLDEAAPEARIEVQGEALVVHTGAQTPDIGAVEVHAPGRVWRLAPDAGLPASEAEAWRLPLDLLPPAFTVVVRDRAGNVARWPARQEGGALVVEAQTREVGPAPALPAEAPALQAGQGPMRVEGNDTVVHLADRSLRFDGRPLGLRSLRLTAALQVGDRLLLGTAGGDLLAVTCADGACAATALPTGHPEHPITGFAALPDGRVLVGVLGAGLLALDGDRVHDSGLRVGSRFVTGLATAPDGDVLIGTAYNGLWRLAGGGGGPLRTRFPHEHVAGLRVPGDLLAALPVLEVEIDSGHGRFLQLGRDRYQYDGPGLNDLAQGAPDLVDLVGVGEGAWLAGFDSGLWRLGPEGERVRVALDLTVDEARINALALHAGRLWLATEGGLLSLDPDRPEAGVRRALPGAAHDLDGGEQGLAVATSHGLYVVDGAPRRVDVEGPLASPLVGTGRFLSVAWHQGDLVAGSLDGLLHLARGAGGFEPRPVTAADGLEASWVTALLSDGTRLWIGTYADGVWTLDGEGCRPVEALAGQWVPPHALARVGDDLWVGGIGMAPARLGRDGQATAVRVPVRDVNAVVPGPDGGLLLATSDGLVHIAAPAVAGR